MNPWRPQPNPNWNSVVLTGDAQIGGRIWPQVGTASHTLVVGLQTMLSPACQSTAPRSARRGRAYCRSPWRGGPSSLAVRWVRRSVGQCTDPRIPSSGRRSWSHRTPRLRASCRRCPCGVSSGYLQSRGRDGGEIWGKWASAREDKETAATERRRRRELTSTSEVAGIDGRGSGDSEEEAGEEAAVEGMTVSARAAGWGGCVWR
jgi:hypothetical protein